jgi:hypothetical protein
VCILGRGCIDIAIQDYSSPHTARLLNPYPEEADGLVSETWQALKVREMDPDLLTPMCRIGLKDYFVNELAELEDGSWVIPVCWIVRKKQLCADAYLVLHSSVSHCNM